jgi:hypothetical protein
MYSHYFFTSLGYENPFKKLITQAQLIQFAMCIVHALCVLGFEVVLPRPYAWAQFVYHIQVNLIVAHLCEMSPSEKNSSRTYALLMTRQMLVLFGHFYRKSYLAAKAAKREQAAAKAK